MEVEPLESRSQRGGAGPQHGRMIGVGHPQADNRQVLRLRGPRKSGHRLPGTGYDALGTRVDDGLTYIARCAGQQQEAPVHPSLRRVLDADGEHRPAPVRGEFRHGLGPRHHPGEPVGEVEHATGHVGRVFTQAVTDHHGGRSRERHQPAELGHARGKDRALHRRGLGQRFRRGAEICVDAGRQGVSVSGAVELIGLIENGRDGRIAPAQVGELIEILAAVSGKNDPIAWRLLDPGEENSLVPQRAASIGEVGLVVRQHFR